MEFRILGPVEVWGSDGEIPLDGSKQRTVLAALLLARGRMVSDSHLCRLLWHDNPPATFNAQIYTYVSRLRKYLGNAVTIARQRPGYLLRVDPRQVDSENFARLARLGGEALKAEDYDLASGLLGQALELWRGPALTNVTQQLADEQAHRLDESRLVALEGRIEADLALGRHVDLLPELTGVVAEHPMHERFRALLMSTLWRCDRQADALAVFHDGRKVLAEELGVSPGRLLTDTYRAILVGETQQRPGRAATVRHAAAV
ncbi:hypothetical protein Cme02nite_73190 [Catellatospora methionotrophica]|uniref:OmpR/PhoB-type domain-containing protein n=1 Tax=Catellatospora methionotrophica TaxID=121620 RepID=A0A8J3LE10_9ACTN|nr:AfsR/SARP family transcriptional regulator [Catellatospora methionotrophica]GIG18987.1 hypothetical protein Cme02nite_73190 [Catellatospora methionotrophica]